MTKHFNLWRAEMKKLLLVISLSFVLLMPPMNVMADTYVTKNIIEDATWDISGSPYIISDTIQVYENVTLTILPGVEVVFQGTASMEIGGQIIAKGTAVSTIKFSSNNVWNRTQSGKISGISFHETAPSASYKPGDRPTFIHDYQNNQLLLEYDDTQGYDSGSIFDYCIFDNFDIAIKSSNSLPCLINSTIKNSYYGLYVEYDPELPQYRWLFVYNNTIESCEVAIIVGKYPVGYFRRGIALISGNIIKDCGLMGTQGVNEVMVAIDGDRSGIFLFNNQIINGAGLGFGNVHPDYIYIPTDLGIGPVILMEHNSITHNYAGVAVNGCNALLHNYIAQNQTAESWTDRVLGAGIFLTGPVGMVFNNSIQLNGVNGVTRQVSHGDGIALSSSENNKFIINYNNLGNSVWDMQDLYLYADGDSCATSKLMNVDAKFNSWNVPDINIPSHIFDQNDDMCAGMVDYLPALSSAMIPDPLDTHPSLQSPVDNAYIPDTKNVAFSWSAVNGATKYMLGVFGKDCHYSLYSLNKLEIVNTTSATIDFSSIMKFDYGMKVIHWFVIAGNDNGWGLPSALRKVTFSPDPVLVSGKVHDENASPLIGVYVGYIPHSGAGANIVHSFSDESGNYTLIPEFSNNNGQIAPHQYTLRKRGYVPCYTYSRGQREFNIAPDLMIISPQRRDSLYNAAGITRDTNKGEIAGVIINENDEALVGAEVSIEPSSGVIYYLDDNRNPDPSLTATGTLGEFVILNVTPGAYTLTATLNGTTFDTTISVYKGSVTLDALIEGTSSDTGGGGGDVGVDDGGGGGGGCFIATAGSGVD